MTPPKDPNGWDMWGAHVLADLAEHGDLLRVISQQLSDQRVDIGKMKTEMRIKSGILVVVGGVVGSVAVMAFQVFAQSKG